MSLTYLVVFELQVMGPLPASWYSPSSSFASRFDQFTNVKDLAATYEGLNAQARAPCRITSLPSCWYGNTLYRLPKRELNGMTLAG